MDVARIPLPDGRVLLVEPFFDDGRWYVRIESDEHQQAIGWPLAPTLADVIGYDVAQEEWPSWIDEAAAAIVAEARNQGLVAPKDL